jgi:hypothetical protein
LGWRRQKNSSMVRQNQLRSLFKKPMRRKWRKYLRRPVQQENLNS